MPPRFDSKRLHREVELYRAALIRASMLASLGELAIGIASALGNPMATISGRMELLEMQLRAGRGDPTLALDSIAITRQAAERANLIIHGVKSLAQDSDHDPFQTVCVEQLLRFVTSFTWEHFQKLGIRLVQRPIERRLEIACRDVQISRVLLNLLNNAKDAVLHVDDRLVALEVIEHGETIDIAVSDSGPGVPAEIRDKIMLPFFTTKPSGEGAGLGLSVSKTIVEQHGGRLWLDTRRLHTRFVVTVPRDQRKGALNCPAESTP